MDNRKEVLYSDLPALVSDQSQLSTIRVLDKWATVTYETPKVSGTMLYAAPKVKPAPITLNLNLTGWYKVFVLCARESQEIFAWPKDKSIVSSMVVDFLHLFLKLVLLFLFYELSAH